MNDTTKALLLRAGQRSRRETEFWRSLHCFGPKACSVTATLRAVAEHTIAGKASVHLRMDHDVLLLLVPTVGAITYTDSLGCRCSIAAGQVYRCFLPAGAEATLDNPYAGHLVNVLQFDLLPQPGTKPEPHIHDFDLAANPDCLVQVFSCSNRREFESGNYRLSIGKFAGRKEAVYKLKEAGHRLFVFVIEGAFEVQYRLMEGGDALLLWNGAGIELEALSNKAVILLLELPE